MRSALRDKRGRLEAKSALVKIALVAQVVLLPSAGAASADLAEATPTVG